ncbi:22033_t:CDS:1, partial [Racocetra persica]
INWEGEKLAIPFTDLDLYLFDNAWNVDEQYAKNRTIGLVNKLEADQLQKMLGLPSRTQRLKEKTEVE